MSSMNDRYECVVHGTHQVDTDCEHCKKEVENLSSILESKTKACIQMDGMLAADGASIPPALRLHWKMELLLDLVLNDKQRHMFEINFLNKVGSEQMSLQQAIRDERRGPKLMHPNGQKLL